MARPYSSSFLSAAALAAFLVVAPHAVAQTRPWQDAERRRPAPPQDRRAFRGAHVPVARGRHRLAARRCRRSPRARTTRWQRKCATRDLRRRATEIALAARQRTPGARRRHAVVGPRSDGGARQASGRRPQGRRRFSRRGSEGRSRAGAGGSRGRGTAIGRSVPGAQSGVGLRAGQGGDLEARAGAGAALSQQRRGAISPSRSPRTTRDSRISSRPRSRCRRSIARSSRSRAGSRRSCSRSRSWASSRWIGRPNILVEVLKSDAGLRRPPVRRWCKCASSKSAMATPRRFCKSSGKRTRAITSISSAWRCSRCRPRIGQKRSGCSRN